MSVMGMRSIGGLMETDDWLEAGRGMAFQNSNFRVYLPPGHFIKSWNYTDFHVAHREWLMLRLHADLG